MKCARCNCDTDEGHALCGWCECDDRNAARRSSLAASDCSPPLGESGEAYYCKRDDFTRYIESEVNPARIKAGLQPLDMKSAEECYRILNDFARKWGCKPIADHNPQISGGNPFAASPVLL